MEAEIITIGDEILIGQITDTNSAWIAQQLNLIGIHVDRITSISDTEKAIIQAIKQVQPTTKLVLITGGLGPTKDDITKLTLANLFGMKLVFNENIYSHIEDIFRSLGRTPVERNREQAFVPDGCRILFNDVGTAPGMLFVQNERYFISMPGVPYEMKFLMNKWVLPIAEKELLRQTILHETILTVGIPESELAEKLQTFEEELPDNIKLAYLPRPGLVRLRLTAKGESLEQLEKAMTEEAEKIKSLLGSSAFGTGTDSLESIIGELLKSRNQTIATAESCTGGYIAHLITTIPGSSAYFKGSIVAYANEVKQMQLDVEEGLIKKHGAVSKEVVEQMAIGARKQLKTDWAIATSGIAGPDGGTDEKPVGTVWISISGPKITKSRKFQLGKDRGRNIKKSAFLALDLLRNLLLAE